MRKLLRKQGFAPKTVTTHKLRSYSAAFQRLGRSRHHERDCDRTIGPRTATKRHGGVSERSSALSRPDRLSDSSASTPSPTTIFTVNATWSLDRRFGLFRVEAAVQLSRATAAAA
jgi:transposase-like protein